METVGPTVEIIEVCVWVGGAKMKKVFLFPFFLSLSLVDNNAILLPDSHLDPELNAVLYF